MKHGSTSGRGKRVILSLLATACLVAGSPVVANASNAGGAQKPVSATFGDCKNDNAGKHLGYVCPSADDNTGGDNGGGGVITAS